jgi:hypothetical protein
MRHFHFRLPDWVSCAERGILETCCSTGDELYHIGGEDVSTEALRAPLGDSNLPPACRRFWMTACLDGRNIDLLISRARVKPTHFKESSILSVNGKGEGYRVALSSASWVAHSLDLQDVRKKRSRIGSRWTRSILRVDYEK